MFMIHKFNCQCYHNIETITNIHYRALCTIFLYIEYKVYPLCWVAVEPLQTPYAQNSVLCVIIYVDTE